jgi:hypothetical protein
MKRYDALHKKGWSDREETFKRATYYWGYDKGEYAFEKTNFFDCQCSLAARATGLYD